MYNEPDTIEFVCKSETLSKEFIEFQKKAYPSLRYRYEEISELTEDDFKQIKDDFNKSRVNQNG